MLKNIQFISPNFLTIILINIQIDHHYLCLFIIWLTECFLVFLITELWRDILTLCLGCGLDSHRMGILVLSHILLLLFFLFSSFCCLLSFLCGYIDIEIRLLNKHLVSFTWIQLILIFNMMIPIYPIIMIPNFLSPKHTIHKFSCHFPIFCSKPTYIK